MRTNSKPAFSIKPWLLASRPKTLPAAISPVLVGWSIAIAINRFSVGPAIAILFCATMIQIGTNYFNDVIDFGKGADTHERLGPVRVTQAGLLTPRQVWTGGILSFLMAALAGIYLAAIAGWPVILIGTASLLAGLAYSAGPYPLVNIGLADVFVFIFFGFVAVCGTVFALTGSVPLLAWISSLAIGALTTNILVINNIRDIKTDTQVGRRNMAVSFGRKAAEYEYSLLLILAYAIPVIVALSGINSWFSLLPLLTTPKAVRLVQKLKSTPVDRSFNLLLAETAQLLLFFSILYSFGIGLSILL